MPQIASNQNVRLLPLFAFASLLINLEFIPIRIPKFFTPDGNGINEGWRPLNIEQYQTAIIKIFDRYGRLIETLGPSDKWYGVYDGNNMPSGDYWYLITFREEAHSEDPLIGHFSLYR